jgi:hypothetical protein
VVGWLTKKTLPANCALLSRRRKRGKSGRPRERVGISVLIDDRDPVFKYGINVIKLLELIGYLMHLVFFDDNFITRR